MRKYFNTSFYADEINSTNELPNINQTRYDEFYDVFYKTLAVSLVDSFKCDYHIYVEIAEVYPGESNDYIACSFVYVNFYALKKECK